MLASCKKSWPFQIGETDKTVHACVQCKPDAPLPFVIAKDGIRLIWACNANKFKVPWLCKKWLSWLDPPGTKWRGPKGAKWANRQNGPILTTCWANRRNRSSFWRFKPLTIKTCAQLKTLSEQNDKAAELYSRHNQDLKLAEKLTSEPLYSSENHGFLHQANQTKLSPLGVTQITVKKSVHVAYAYHNAGHSRVFTVLSHAVRACGNIPEHPLRMQCLDTKRLECVWRLVKGRATKLKSGQKLLEEDHMKMDQPCTPENLLSLSTSRKL